MIMEWAGRRQWTRECWSQSGQLDLFLPPSLIEISAQREESEKEKHYRNKNVETVVEEDEDYERDEEEEMEILEIDFDDLFSDDNDDGSH